MFYNDQELLKLISMCYDVSAQLRSKIKYAKHIGASPEEIANLERQLDNVEWKPQYRIDGFSKTKPKVPVVTNDKPNKIQFFDWRFLSDSVIKSKKYLNTLNAKSESIYNSWTYKEAAEQRHCLVLVDGFYEPHGFGKQKKSFRYGKEIIDFSKKAYYYIESKLDSPLALAGLWNMWLDKETGELYDTFTIITAPASPLMSKIHNVAQRMPVVVPKELHSEWLNSVGVDDPLQKQKALELLKCHNDEELNYKTIYNIKKRDAAGNEPEILTPYDYTEDEEFEPID